MQDHDSVHTCQALITKYLLDISCKVDQMHEFTDGCAVQYNSRHCVGDLSCSLGRKFKEVKGIRKLHCIKTGSEQEKVLARQRSCYCISCTHDDEENCSNKAWLDDWKEVLVNCKL